MLVAYTLELFQEDVSHAQQSFPYLEVGGLWKGGGKEIRGVGVPFWTILEASFSACECFQPSLLSREQRMVILPPVESGCPASFAQTVVRSCQLPSTQDTASGGVAHHIDGGCRLVFGPERRGVWRWRVSWRERCVSSCSLVRKLSSKVGRKWEGLRSITTATEAKAMMEVGRSSSGKLQGGCSLPPWCLKLEYPANEGLPRTLLHFV